MILPMVRLSAGWKCCRFFQVAFVCEEVFLYHVDRLKGRLPESFKTAE
ncbi:hypothetical protein EIKCOROL_01376 [Eikenella corrodens ATCC 23834]|uniref:Uncharacterized protein n=1 Tax=Eikenella corrodens ATCC 23834 TaxID=546274 RepID=C0DVI7_EIKCO|nr:hypothetical protein EIKCOROL_01376 [Eikenella corrodens ATCC 23834]